MARKQSKHQAKHFQPEDHAHAAHQEQASRGPSDKHGRAVAKETKSRAAKTTHPMEQTPRGPRRGQ